jgi:site-specific DNA-adenine methylase
MMWLMNYPGGKGKCYQRLINLMPPHATYIESHLGGGAVLRNKLPARRNIGIDADESVIKNWKTLHPDLCTLVHGDAVAFLEQYAFTGDELVYADPPYLPSVRRRSKIYRHEYTNPDHERLLNVLKTLPCKVMLSGYDSLMYRERLVGWRKVTFSAKTHVDVREECVWMNYLPPTALHDASFLGTTFRDRQTVKRRHQRTLERFDRMDPVERNHLLQLLNAQFGEAGNPP